MNSALRHEKAVAAAPQTPYFAHSPVAEHLR